MLGLYQTIFMVTQSSGFSFRVAQLRDVILIGQSFNVGNVRVVSKHIYDYLEKPQKSTFF